MNKSLVMKTGFTLLLLFLAMCFMPIAHASFPKFDVNFQPTDPQSVQWNMTVLGLKFGSTHIYGNFCLSLINPEFVDYVEFRVGDDNRSDPFDGRLWDLMWNDSSEPFEWNFNTLDFTVGVHSISATAYYDGQQSSASALYTTLHGTTRTYYFEHDDRSGEQDLLLILPIGLIVLSIIVTIFIYRKRRQ